MICIREKPVIASGTPSGNHLFGLTDFAEQLDRQQFGRRCYKTEFKTANCCMDSQGGRQGGTLCNLQSTSMIGDLGGTR